MRNGHSPVAKSVEILRHCRKTRKNGSDSRIARHPENEGSSITKFAQKIVIFSRFFVVVEKNDEKIVDFGVFHQITHFSTLVFHNRCVKRGKVVLATPHFGGKQGQMFHIFNGLFHRKIRVNP